MRWKTVRSDGQWDSRHVTRLEASYSTNSTRATTRTSRRVCLGYSVHIYRNTLAVLTEVLERRLLVLFSTAGVLRVRAFLRREACRTRECLEAPVLDLAGQYRLRATFSPVYLARVQRGTASTLIPGCTDENHFLNNQRPRVTS